MLQIDLDLGGRAVAVDAEHDALIDGHLADFAVEQAGFLQALGCNSGAVDRVDDVADFEPGFGGLCAGVDADDAEALLVGVGGAGGELLGHGLHDVGCVATPIQALGSSGGGSGRSPGFGFTSVR